MTIKQRQHINKTALLNATSIVIGGGIQACVSFIRYALRNKAELDWHFAVSSQIAEELNKFGIDTKADNWTIFYKAPSRSSITRKQLQALERKIKPNIVFTFFGPAYVKFNAFHICGIADGWVTHGTRLAYATLKNQALTMFLRCLYKGFWFRRADYWLVEAQSARKGFNRRYFAPKEKIKVIANSCGEHYLQHIDTPHLLSETKKFRILTFAAYYPNKNIEIIPLIAIELKNRGLSNSIEFVLTIDKNEPNLANIYTQAKQLGVNHMINNIGKVAIKDGPGLYKSCSALLMPSLLETFSACYPEAMSMGIPIITTDLDFSKEICGNAALYYPPINAIEAANLIEKIYTQPDLRKVLSGLGSNRLQQLIDPNKKNEAILTLINELLIFKSTKFLH